MFVLLDQGTPVPIRPFLVGHTVETAAQRRWDKLKNGELVGAAEGAGFAGHSRQEHSLPTEFSA